MEHDQQGNGCLAQGGFKMKNMIERYVYAVTRRLPETIQEEVKQELKANIYDMLPEGATDEQIERVLRELGHPRDMAVKYQPKDRYLISPRYFADYLYTLKIVVIILILIGFAVGTLETVIGHTPSHFFEFIGSIFQVIFESIFDGLFTAFVIVTIIFVIIEHAQHEKKAEWKVKDLPELPKENHLNISRTTTVLAIILSVSFSVVFILILVDYHRLIGIYDEGVRIAPFFNPDAIKVFVPIFIIGLIIGLIAHILKLIDGRWTMRTTITYSCHEVFDLIVLAAFLTTSTLILPEFYTELARLMELTSEEVARAFDVGFGVIIAVATVATVIELGVLWYKVIKHKRKVTTSK
jgi:hypothetical protein